MLLSTGIFFEEEWNGKILPAIKEGRISRKTLVPKHLWRTFQVFNGILEEDEELFYVVAWCFPNTRPYVVVSQ